MKNQKAKLTVETLTKDVPFDDVLPLIKPMISRIAYSATGVYGLEQEDLEQELSIKAFMSWQTWEPGCGTKFSTYVYEILKKHKNYLVRTAMAQRRNSGMRVFSLDGPSDGDSGHGDKDPYAIYDFCADTSGINLDDYVYMLEIRDVVEKVFLEQSSRAQVAIQGVLEGQTQEAVSRNTGITQSLISYYLNIFRTKLREELERREFDLPMMSSTKNYMKAETRDPVFALVNA